MGENDDESLTELRSGRVRIVGGGQSAVAGARSWGAMSYKSRRG